MAYNPYVIEYVPELTTLRDDYIFDAFANAQLTMLTNGCPTVTFLQLQYSGGQIYRLSDNSVVTFLTPAERFALFPQLNGLFKLGIEKVFYP